MQTQVHILTVKLKIIFTVGDRVRISKCKNVLQKDKLKTFLHYIL